MKTSIVTALLAVGMLLRPQPMPVADNVAIPDNPVAISATQQTAPQILTANEMNTAVGTGIAGCYESKAANGDTYYTCCVDLWIFAVCASVNYSALQRLIPII